MRQLFTRSRRLKRLLSVTLGRRSREEESTEEDGSSDRASTLMEPLLGANPPLKPTWRCFSYGEIHSATNGFHKDNLVGRGGHAEVYRGVTADGQAVAVKRLMRASTDEQREKDFLTELGTVGHVRHPNVSALLGCCIDRDLHLIFEFSSRGSVSSNLHGSKLNELQRRELAPHGLEAAAQHRPRHRQGASLPPQGVPEKDHPQRHQGLQHTPHIQSRTSGTAHRTFPLLNPMTSRDHATRSVSESNLRSQTLASPNGFRRSGLTVPWLQSKGHSGTHLRPLLGFNQGPAACNGAYDTNRCLAPEYFMHGIVGEKTDVFAFGVFLLEMVSGRKPVDGSHKSLLSWARPFLKDDAIQMLVDPRLGEEYDMGQLRRLTFAASLCIRATSTLRPSMTEVLELLEGSEISQDQWKIPDEEDEQEFGGFDDLDDDDDDDCDTPSTSSTGSSQPQHVFYKQQHSNTELRWRSGDTCNGSHRNKEMSYVTLTGGRGTPGYAAPELWMPIPVTQKCDVYSFGMLLFEILGRRRNLQFQESAESQAFEWFPRWVWQKFEHGEMESIVSACGIEEEDREKAERMCQVALWCVQYQPEARPSMGSVVRMLEGEDEIVPPTNPFQYMASLSVSSASGTVNTNASTSSATGIDDSDDTFSATCTSTNLRSQTQPEDNRIKRKMTPNATEKAEGHSDLNINPPRKPDNVYINTR
ncbi:Protein kinase domain containing protein [Musa troglodytarum]|uniref:Protein kinase domain containing protein n=1 Tax=Musa troglodytarum TaxID=320322 RepID=A0A9E7I584_9LILI|nr:Protein kinase domain containing protein [Musa troglodytarum]